VFSILCGHWTENLLIHPLGTSESGPPQHRLWASEATDSPVRTGRQIARACGSRIFFASASVPTPPLLPSVLQRRPLSQMRMRCEATVLGHSITAMTAQLLRLAPARTGDTVVSGAQRPGYGLGGYQWTAR
jgi:hypothetical protein